MLTKEQERQLVRKLAKDAPDGYVKDLLAEAEPLWIQAIDNDFCVANLRELWDQKAELRREIALMESRKAELDKEVAKREAGLARANRQLVELASTAEALARSLRSAANCAGNWCHVNSPG